MSENRPGDTTPGTVLPLSRREARAAERAAGAGALTGAGEASSPHGAATRSSARSTERAVLGAPVISLDGVRKRYRGAAADALCGVDLSVRAGEFVYLVGSSGSGKSTLLKVIYGAERADHGDVTVAGVDLRRLRRVARPAFRRRVGVVHQDFQLLTDRSVTDNVAFALLVTGNRDQVRDRVPHVLDLVGLAHLASRLPNELSGGEQQRVAVARAIVNRPALLVADEPTGNLDPDTSEQILAVLADVNRAGTTVVMATHDENLVTRHPYRVVVVDSGLVAQDIPDPARTDDGDHA